MRKAISIINFLGIQKVKTSTMHIQGVSPDLRILNKRLRQMKNYYIQKLHNVLNISIDLPETSCVIYIVLF